MPTVDDLRAALTSLEREAPAVDELLATSLAPQSVKRRSGTWPLPAAIAGLTVAVVIGVAGLVTLGIGTGHSPGARQTTNGSGGVGGSRLLPFRLAGSLPQLSLLDVHSETSPANSFGTAVVAEYGMEVTIHVNTAIGQAPQSAAASRITVGRLQGWVDASCGVRPAPSSVPPSDSSSIAPAFNPSCALSYDSGPWHVAIYVAGPGGGSRKVTAQQFVQIGDRLQLAGSPSDPSTWFAADELLPK